MKSYLSGIGYMRYAIFRRLTSSLEWLWQWQWQLALFRVLENCLFNKGYGLNHVFGCLITSPSSSSLSSSFHTVCVEMPNENFNLQSEMQKLKNSPLPFYLNLLFV